MAFVAGMGSSNGMTPFAALGGQEGGFTAALAGKLRDV